MDGMKNAPSAERILSILADLLADQYGVKIKYTIVDGGEPDVLHGRSPA